jgi:hypothetical protein
MTVGTVVNNVWAFNRVGWPADLSQGNLIDRPWSSFVVRLQDRLSEKESVMTLDIEVISDIICPGA